MTITNYRIRVNDIQVNGIWLKQVQYIFEQVNQFGESKLIYKTFDEVPERNLEDTLLQAEKLVNSYAKELI